MPADQHFSRQQNSTSRARVQVPLPKSAEFACTYIRQPREDIDAQAHQAIEAIAAAVLGAQASLNWLRVQPSDLEEVGEALNSIVNNGKRAAEIVRRLQGLAKKSPKARCPGTWHVSCARHQLELDFAHMNRVSAMGELAASLSHEILHPIATARNNARAGMRFLEMNPPNLGEAREAFGCVVRDADLARDIVGRMRDQIKKAPPRKERFDLNAALSEVLVLARGVTHGNGVSIQTRLADGLLPVLGDRIQLQQVLLNLILNAAEAMSSVEEGERELLISTEQDQTGALVAVRDSGPGIDAQHLDRVFDAFYTTKSSGTGMGLSICRSIIHAHGGKLWAEMNEPRGALFQFTLPADNDS